MAFITSRPSVPANEDDMRSEIWFNLWARRLWPIAHLEAGSELFWYETTRKALVWRTMVRDLLTFQYGSHAEAAAIVTEFSGVRTSAADPYVASAASSGQGLVYRVEPIARTNVPRPENVRLPRMGWAKSDDPGIGRWLDDARRLSRDQDMQAHINWWLQEHPRRPGAASTGASVACRDYQAKRTGEAKWSRYCELFGLALLETNPHDGPAIRDVLRGRAMQAGVEYGGKTFERRWTVWAWANEPALARRAGLAAPGSGVPPSGPQVARRPPTLPDYRPPPRPKSPSAPEPFSKDPDLVDRGTQAHHDTVAALLEWVKAQGHRPLGPLGAPEFDLAWWAGATLVVAEVKSITAGNERSQLRHGLGQVLQYRQQLVALGFEPVEAWLVPEREPSEGLWDDVCRSAGVSLFVVP